MKAKYLFSALAVSTAFVACNNEDLTVNQSVITNGQEIVGEELLGTGLSIYIDNEDRSATRATNSGWTVGDVAGIGWVVKGNPFSSQEEVGLYEVDPTLYANHYYAFEGEGKWTTKSNIYRGWHFAYFPFEYHQEAQPLMFYIGKNAKGENHVFSLKDAAKDDAYKADIINNAPHISAAAFLDASKVDIQSGAIKESFSVERVVNALLPELMISDLFKEDETGYLKNLKIKSVTLNTKEPVLTHAFKVVPKNLAENIKVDENLDSEATRVALLNNIIYQDPNADVQEENGAALVVNGDYERTQTIELTDEFTLAQDHLLRMFIAPVTSDKKAAGSLDFTVTLEDGSVFKVNASQDENKTAIQRVVALFNGGWAHPTNGNTYSFRNLSYNGGKKVNPAQRIQLQLNRENFTPNFVINEPADWARCVSLANALKESATFTVNKDVVIEFGDGEKMLAPEFPATILTNGNKKATLKVVGTTAWNNNIQFDEDQNVTVEVAEEGTLTVVGSELQDVTLVNNGNIDAKATAKIGNTEKQNLTNNGTITIEYGAYIYPATDKEGTIAYKLKATDGAYQVNTLLALELTTDQQGTANVNKFIVEGIEWNLDEPTKGQAPNNDAYHKPNGIDDTKYNYGALAAVDVEIINGQVYADKENVWFKNVNMEGALSVLSGVSVSENVTVKDQGHVSCKFLKNIDTNGEVTAEVIAGNVTNATIVNAVNVMGTINATGDVIVKNVINGEILNAANVTAASVNSSIKATGDVKVTNNIGGNVEAKTVTAGLVTGDVKATGDVNATLINGAVITAAKVTANEVKQGITATGDVDVDFITNGGVTTQGNVVAKSIKGDVVAANVTVTDGTIDGNVTGVAIIAYEVTGGIIATGNVEVTTIGGNVAITNGTAETLALTSTAVAGDVKFTNGKINIYNATVKGDVNLNDVVSVAKNINVGKTLTIEGSELTTAKSSNDITIKNLVIGLGSSMSVHNTVITETIKNWGLLETSAVGYVYYQEGKLQNMSVSATVKGNVLPQ